MQLPRCSRSARSEKGVRKRNLNLMRAGSKKKKSVPPRGGADQKDSLKVKRRGMFKRKDVSNVFEGKRENRCGNRAIKKDSHKTREREEKETGAPCSPPRRELAIIQPIP